MARKRLPYGTAAFPGTSIHCFLTQCLRHGHYHLDTTPLPKIAIQADSAMGTTLIPPPEALKNLGSEQAVPLGYSSNSG
jgi:hypothetical protein